MEYFVLVLLFAIVYLMIFGVPKGWLKNKKKGDSVDDYIAKRQTQYTQSELDDFDRRHADVLNADYGYVNKIKSSYPIITNEMIQPVDAKISTVQARSIFRKIMLELGALDKQEVGYHVEYFSEEMKSYSEMLEAEYNDSKQEISAIKKQISELKRDAKKEKDPEEVEGIEDEIQDLQDEIEIIASLGAEKNHREFKSDKRAFLIDYINRQLQR